MKRTDKEGFVEGFRERLQESPAIFLTDFTGLDVKSITVLRAELKKNGAEYLVVKNRLLLRALEGTELPDLSDWLTGPTGIVLGHSGPVEAAKTISDFAKSHDDRPAFKVAVLDQALLDAAQIQQLAKLPPRDQLLAMLAGALEAPMAALAGALEAKLHEMVGLMKALQEQKEGGED
ncbi:MAG: 50S ribosomal protein L10 [Gemmatimonadetes bacterium]|nr:50S ribosomal protein L10 [Gemmatimonadota bacterium]NNM04478.1 50S ribosomal protein L10 [Gemmatimonadota bacterium]